MIEVEQLDLPRLTGLPQGPLTLAHISRGQANLLKLQYLKKVDRPAWRPGALNIALLAAGQLFGIIAPGTPRLAKTWCDTFLWVDLAIECGVPRLSKLVVACALTKEVKGIVEARYGRRVRTIGTTAYTAKAVSMKYRGLFDVRKRKDDRIHYVAGTGRWTLTEALKWWNRTQK